MRLVLYDTNPPEPGGIEYYDQTLQEMEIIDPTTDFNILSSPPVHHTHMCSESNLLPPQDMYPTQLQNKLYQNATMINDSSDPLAGPSFPNKRQALCVTEDFPALPRPSIEERPAKSPAVHDIRTTSRTVSSTGTNQTFTFEKT
ncbi:hypothetical protein GcM3_043027 [Golovinomyces cichoracearum]|uniref:Uncharacterized protein n=1 Tax=Golovinomyces cichoracearum TaxID=62708 RepID=A0A420J1L8_9PEZI|nr:hypothetical protein GcM3_043027 [Golovinomyces cichoracearum]